MKYFIFLMTAVGYLISCGPAPVVKQASEEVPETSIVTLTDQQFLNGGFQLDTLRTVVLSKTLTVNGSIDVPPQNIVSVSFPTGGYLKSTRLLPGMRVTRGESIAFIEDQSLIQLQQDFLVTKSKLEYSRLEFERQQSLNETKTSSDKTFQLARTEYESLQVMLRALSEKLLLVGIDPLKLTADNISRSVGMRSPITGFVSKVNVNIGKYVQPSEVLFELINPEDLHAALTVFEKDIDQVKAGQRVDVSFVNEPTTLYPAEVLLVTSNVDESRSGTVHCHFEKAPAHLKPGMFINAVIHLSSARTPVIPEEAVVRFEGKQYVFYQKSKTEYELVSIEAGTKQQGMVEIKSKDIDLTGKKLVVKNAFMLLSKMKNVSEE